MMLQQTQVDRVIPKYKAFIKQYPTVQRLARASLSDCLQIWQGLGYNRRAKFLRSAAIAVVKEYGGVFPKTHTELETLPGIGPYTASAICAFAYNLPVAMIETNIRQVFIEHFFKNQTRIADGDILAIIDSSLDRKNPREWYWALMDYGSYLKSKHGNINKKSKHYVKQSPFIGSLRQVRGAIIKLLLENSLATPAALAKRSGFSLAQILLAAEQLQKEKLIRKHRSSYRLS
jgi:A/G-specific adenine glycosylase